MSSIAVPLSPFSLVLLPLPLPISGAIGGVMILEEVDSSNVYSL